MLLAVGYTGFCLLGSLALQLLLLPAQLTLRQG
jgi:hypothetical protein